MFTVWSSGLSVFHATYSRDIYFSGAGENLRGAFMGALDTFTNDESTPHDDIVRQGKLEMERGFAHLRSSKEKGQGSFAIGSTAPPVSYTHNKAGTGGIEKVQEANIPGPDTYETGMDCGIVPNTGGFQFNDSNNSSMTKSSFHWFRRSYNLNKS